MGGAPDKSRDVRRRQMQLIDGELAGYQNQDEASTSLSTVSGTRTAQ